MNSFKLMILMVFGVACLGQVAAEDRDFDDRWHFSPTVGAALFDNNREAVHTQPYLGLGFGRFITRNFSLDARYDRYHGNMREVPSGEVDRFRLASYGLVGRWHFAGNELIRPYVLLGTGIQEHRNFFDNGRDVYGSLGFGLNSRVSERIDFRLEAEGRLDNDRDTFERERGFKDILLTAGLNIRLGAAPIRAQREPVPAAAPPPTPAPRPAPTPPPPDPAPEVIFEFDAMVTFNLDSARLRPASIAELNEAVAMLRLHPEITQVEVAGHTCDLGAANYNQGLSERRANAVRDHLVENGIDANRLVVRGHGEDRPKVPNTSERNRQQNRRVELVVLERRDR